MDGDGHFHAAHPTDRPAVLELIKKVDYGNFFNEIINDDEIQIKSDLSQYCCKDWNELVQSFIRIGKVEYVTLSSTIPSGCQCATKKVG
tara:strand:- start:2758 stop:3024 length:267 start_codon:yes stop_codon:yes gene_type:complete